MKELIEKLKKNEKPFGLLSEEEQECLRKVGDSNCLLWKRDSWIRGEFVYASEYTYRISPDYQPEPEFEDVEIERLLFNKENKWMLGIIFRSTKIKLHEIPSMPNFRRFISCAVKIPPEDVAEHISQGTKVYARFVKE